MIAPSKKQINKAKLTLKGLIEVTHKARPEDKKFQNAGGSDNDGARMVYQAALREMEKESK